MWRYIQHLKTLFITLIGLFTLSMNAQVYPVVVNQSIAVPYYGKLGQYSTSTQEKLQLFLNLTDISIANRLVRLRLVIEGNGLLISSVNNVMGATPLYLTGGVSQRFTNIDLRPYFELQNLQGINFEQYQRLLPEGMYTFRWEVYDLFTNELLSNPNSGQSLIYITQNDPPLLNLPLKDEIVTASETPNILFQWTPRHNTATAVAYEFEIKELWDTQIDPQAAFLASPTYYTETTRATSLLYNLTKPQLIPGKTYAWRVRATSDIGFGETASFKNNGYSEIYNFNYNTQCDPVKFALAEVQEKRSAKISWLGDPSYQNYHLQYRKADQEDADWFEVYTQNTQSLIANLEYDTTYEYRVGATCMPLTQLNPQYTYGNLAQFTIPSQADSRNYACGLLPNIEISNQNTLQNLGVNESFTAGDFPVTVKQVNSNGDRFSGLGFVTVPYLEDTKIAVRFENIKINTDYQLIDGVVETTYDLEAKGIKDATQEIEAVIQAITFVGDKIGALFEQQEAQIEALENAKTDEERQSISETLINTQKSTDQEINNYVADSDAFMTPEQKEAYNDVKDIDKIASTELSPHDIENLKKASQKKAETIAKIVEEVELVKDETFVKDALTFLSTDDIFEVTLEKIRSIETYLQKTEESCSQNGFASHKNEGIYPKCLWENLDLNDINYYGAVDFAFQAGMIDGLYQEVEGLVLLPKYLLDLGAFSRKLTYAYTLSFWTCRKSAVEANDKRIEALINQLAENDTQTGLWAWVKEKYYENELEDANETKADCESEAKLRKEVNTFFTSIQDVDYLKKQLDKLKTKISSYLNHLEDQDNLGRYYTGKNLIAVASMFTGIGEITKIGQTSKWLTKITNYTDTEWKKVVKALEDSPNKSLDDLGELALEITDEALKAELKRNTALKDLFLKATREERDRMMQNWRDMDDIGMPEALKNDEILLKRKFFNCGK